MTEPVDLRAELLAELDRREQIARAQVEAGPGCVRLPPALPADANVSQSFREAYEDGYRHATSDADPASVLRQLAGVRAVVEMHAVTVTRRGAWCSGCPSTPPPEQCAVIPVLHDAYCGGGDG